jgi:hypothetical protein
MSQYKVTQIFSDTETSRGFTEVFYVQGSTLQAAYQAALPVSTARDFLTTFYTSAIKVSDVTNSKNEFSQYFPTGINIPVNQPNVIEDSWLVYAQASSGKIRCVYLRAISDDWVMRSAVGGILYPINPAMQMRFDAWSKALVAASYQIRQRDPAQVKNPQVPNTGVSWTNNGYVQVALSTTTGIVAGGSIIVSGFTEDLSFLNGVYGSKDWGTTSSGVLLTKNAVAASDVPNVLNGVKVQNLGYVYNTITSLQLAPTAVTTRKVGQSFRIRRGRNRNRKS